jgi:hypothetical protein
MHAISGSSTPISRTNIARAYKKKNSFTSALPTIQSNLHAVLTFQFLQGSIHESIPRVHQALLKIQPFQSLAAPIA